LKNILLGHTGFVGSNLKSQYDFDLLVNRENIHLLKNLEVERVICCAIPAAKWLANRNPKEDRDNMMRLCDSLSRLRAKKFILISTIDVYPNSCGFDESYDCSTQSNHAYGSNRLEFEEFIQNNFSDYHIVRLPALFGEGLKKNIIFDLMYDNCLHMINPLSSFQWYPLSRLKNDIETAERHDLKLVNLFTEPVTNRVIIDSFFKDKIVGLEAGAEIHYDLYTKYATLFGGSGNYIMSANQVLKEMKKYILSQKNS